MATLKVVEAGRQLDEARGERNKADYDLVPAFERRQATAQVARAEKILETLEAAAELPEVLARITQAIRDHERDVLQDVTWRAPAGS